MLLATQTIIGALVDTWNAFGLPLCVVPMSDDAGSMLRASAGLRGGGWLELRCDRALCRLLCDRVRGEPAAAPTDAEAVAMLTHIAGVVAGALDDSGLEPCGSGEWDPEVPTLELQFRSAGRSCIAQLWAGLPTFGEGAAPSSSQSA